MRLGRPASSRFSALVLLLLALSGCTKDKPKPEEAKKSEPTPVPSGMVFNDFLPTNGNATGLGVRDSGIEGGLAGMGGGAGEPGAADEGAGEGDKLTIKLVEPGAEPRAPRKYAFVANKVDKRVLTITQEVSQSAGGQTAPGQAMTIKLSLDLTAKQVKPTGATLEAKVTKVEVPGAPPQLAQMLASMNGLAGTFDVTSHGEVGEVQFAANAQMRNELAQTVVQGLSQAVQLLLAPLPSQPVGVGAKWEIAAKSEGEQGAKRFTLKEVSNDGAVVESEIAIKVPRRPTQSPRGGTMFVEVDGKGKYTQQVRFNQTVPKAEGDLTVNEKIEMSDPRGGGKQTVLQVQKSKQVVETPGK